MRSLIVLTFIILIICDSIAQADTPPIPPSKKERLHSLQSNLNAQKQKKEVLEQKTKNIKKELGKTKNHLVKIGRSIQKNEKILHDLEQRIDELQRQQLTVQQNLKQDRQSIARLILALERIRRVPPEALIIKPGVPLKTAQSAMLMRDIIPALHKQAETLRLNLENLDEITKDLKIKREKALQASESLRGEHAKLSGLVSKREELYTSTRKDLKQHEENVQRISLQAQNLQDLVQKLDEERKKEYARRQAQKKTSNIPVAELPKPGQTRLPISGVIRIGYDQSDDFGAASKGLTIEALGGALVVAPMGGVVRFAGPFKRYGNIVILEHKNEYHSLIAGLEKIDTVVGQSVTAGEPLGLLRHAVEAGQKPSLYYELRLKGKPVNPAVKFAGLI